MAALAATHTPCIVISSSPPRSHALEDSCRAELSNPAASRPVSPLVLTLSDGNRARPTAFKPGSRAAPIPEGAVTGFRSASVLIKEIEVADETEARKPAPESVMKQAKDTEPKKSSKRSKNPNTDDPEHEQGEQDTGESKPRKRRKSSDTLKVDKKPRAKKQTKKEQSNMLVGNVTKPNISTIESEPGKRCVFKFPPGINVTENTSRYFAKNAAGATVIQSEENLQAAEEETLPHIAPHEVTEPQLEHNTIVERHNAASDIPESFVGDQVANAEPVPAIDDSKSPTKVQSAELHISEISGKPKAEKKKPREKKKPNEKKCSEKKPREKKKPVTITSNAIAKARILPTSSQERALELSSQDDASEEVQAFGSIKLNKPHLLNFKPNKPADQDGKKKRQPAKSNKTAPVEFKLRSPESAMRRIGRQDFLFGTSSQLTREEDPTLVRDLQEAIRVSEAEAEAESHPRKLSESVLRSRNSALPQASRLLWCAVAEGDGEDYYLPRRPARSLETITCGHDPDVPGSPTFIPIDSILEPLESTSGLDRISREVKPPGSRLKLSSGLMSKPRLLFQGVTTKPDPPIGGQTAISQIMSSHVAAQAMQYSTTATASKTNSTTNANDDNVKPPVKRPRGRPRKEATTGDATTPKKATKRRKKADLKPHDKDEFIPIDDIIDPDPPSPSPPRRHTPSVLGQLDLAGPQATMIGMEVDEEARAAAEAAKKARAVAKMRAEVEARKLLFSQITKAIKSAPRADPSKPSWLEKILMYDPIVLEDLTAWLNNGALEAGGGDVSPALQAAAAEDDDDEAECPGNDGKLIKTSLVRKWCDENGVCSVSRDGGEWR